MRPLTNPLTNPLMGAPVHILMQGAVLHGHAGDLVRPSRGHGPFEALQTIGAPVPESQRGKPGLIQPPLSADSRRVLAM